MVTIGIDLFQAWARQDMAQRSQRPVTDCVVIRIEKIAKCGMKYAIASKMFVENKRLEKPSGVRQVPLGGTGIRHGLQAMILNRQGRADSPRHPPDRLVLI